MVGLAHLSQAQLRYGEIPVSDHALKSLRHRRLELNIGLHVIMGNTASGDAQNTKIVLGLGVFLRSGLSKPSGGGKVVLFDTETV